MDNRADRYVEGGGGMPYEEQCMSSTTNVAYLHKVLYSLPVKYIAVWVQCLHKYQLYKYDEKIRRRKERWQGLYYQ